MSGALGRLRGVAMALTSPLHPDDYLKLINPLWSARELRRGRIVAVRPRPGFGHPGDQAGLGLRLRLPARPVHRNRRAGRRPLAVALLLADLGAAHRQGSPSLGQDRDHHGQGHAGGFLSSHLVAGVRPGTIVRLLPPAGQLRAADPAPEAVLFLTAGSGITPVMSMLRTMAQRNQIGGQERSDSGNRAGGQERSDSRGIGPAGGSVATRGIGPAGRAYDSGLPPAMSFIFTRSRPRRI